MLRVSRTSCVLCFCVLAAILFAGTTLDPSVAAAQTPDLIITTDFNDRILRFDGLTGNFLESLWDGSHSGASGVSSAALGMDGKLFAAIAHAGMVVRLNPDSAKFELFSQGGNLSVPHQIAFGPDGDLYIANYGNKRVDRFDGITGKFKLTVFDQFGGEVTGLAVDQDGNVYISERHGNVYKYNGVTIPVFASGLNPEALYIGPDNLLYIVGRDFHGIFRYKLDGTPFGANGNTSNATLASGGGLIDPVGVTIGPDANVYVTDYVSNAVYRYDRVTGAAYGAFTQPGPDIQGAWGISFYVAPDALKTPALPDSVVGSQTAHGRVRLSQPAPAGGAVVWLSSNRSAASVPTFVTVPAGEKNVRFNITTTAVSSVTPVTITASYVGQKKSATFNITP